MGPVKRNRSSSTPVKAPSSALTAVHSDSISTLQSSSARKSRDGKGLLKEAPPMRQSASGARRDRPAKSFPGAVRNTRQRQAVISVFDKVERPLSPEEILKFALRDVAGIGIATVYRSVKQLVQEGYLIAVELPGEPPRYERAGKHHHHHFMCRTCDQVFEIDGCPGDLKRLAPKGFRLEDHSLTLYGLCSHCIS